MKKAICVLLLLSVFLSQNLVYSEEINLDGTESADLCPTANMQENNLPKGKYSCLEGKELEAIKLEKGRKFIVRSKQPMDSNTPIGTLIDFDVIRDVDLFYKQELSKVMFTGEVVENKPPRLVGRSGTLKLFINKIKVDNVTYPAEAYITRMGERQVLGGVLAGTSIYFSNLANVANNGTVTIDKVYKDPCQYSCENITVPLRPFYYLGGAALQIADLFVAPIVCFFTRGKDINIPENTAFEIKLENDISLLKL